MIDLEGGGPVHLDAAATALLEQVQRDAGPDATAYDVMVALVVSRDPSVLPILPMDPWILITLRSGSPPAAMT